MVERMWFGSKLIGEGNGVVRLGPIAAVAEHGIDPWARMWLWCVFIHEVIGTTTVVDTDRFHGVVSFLSFRPLCEKAASTSVYPRQREKGKLCSTQASSASSSQRTYSQEEDTLKNALWERRKM